MTLSTLEERWAADVVERRRASLVSLAEALHGAVAAPTWQTLQEAVDAVPPAASVDVVLAFLRGDGGAGKLALAAATGLSQRESARLALAPLTLAQAATLLTAAGDNVVARELGVGWAAGWWLGEEETLGVLYVGSRTSRVPDESEIGILGDVAVVVGRAAAGVDRDVVFLRRRAIALAREVAPRGRLLEPVGCLRSRELEIIELYAEGLTTAEIAELLVISPHTVRTHVRNALRRLGVRSRDDAVEHVRAWQVATFAGAGGTAVA